MTNNIKNLESGKDEIRDLKEGMNSIKRRIEQLEAKQDER